MSVPSILTAAPTDCEAFTGAWLRQGVNAWSSLGYAVVGVVLVVAAWRRRLPRMFALCGLASVAAGVGSVAYHGRPGGAADAVHDIGLLAVAGFVAGWHAGRWRDVAASGARVGISVGTAAGVVAGVSFSFVGGFEGGIDVVVAIAVATAIGGELLAVRRGLRPVWRGWMLLALVLAVGAWLAGTATSPLCEPSSPWQWHAVWHVASAALVAWWAFVAAAVSGRARSGGQPT